MDELEHAWEARIDSLLGITHNRTLARQHIRDIAHDLKLSEIEIFDSTHLVNCLFCERKHQCEDPRNQATFHESTKDTHDPKIMREAEVTFTLEDGRLANHGAPGNHG